MLVHYTEKVERKTSLVSTLHTEGGEEDLFDMYTSQRKYSGGRKIKRETCLVSTLHREDKVLGEPVW